MILVESLIWSPCIYLGINPLMLCMPWSCLRANGRLSGVSVVFISGWIIKLFPAPAVINATNPFSSRCEGTTGWWGLGRSQWYRPFCTFSRINANVQPAQRVQLEPPLLLLVGTAETQSPCSKQQQLPSLCYHGIKWGRNLFPSQLVLRLCSSDVEVLWCSFLGWKVWFFLFLLWTGFSCWCCQSTWVSTNPAMRAMSAERFYSC